MTYKPGDPSSITGTHIRVGRESGLQSAHILEQTFTQTSSDENGLLCFMT